MKLLKLVCFLLFFVSCHSDEEILSNPDGEAIMYTMNMSPVKTERFNITFNYNGKVYTDKGLLIYPKGYNDKKKNKLVIYCHSGGGFVNDVSSEAELQAFVRYFVSLGYVVLDVNGIPGAVAVEKKIDGGRTVGNPLTLQEYIAGYEYAAKYIDIESTYIFSNSNGGAIASNIVNLTNIDIKAQSGICPLISLKNNGWFIYSGKIGNGEFTSLQNRSNIIRLYGMTDALTQYELMNAVYEEDKVGVYDPFEYVKTYKNKYRAPYKIFQTKDDDLIYHSIAEQFTSLANQYGGNVILRTINSGGHSSEPQPGVVGEYFYKDVKYNLTPTVYEVAKWFEENDGYVAKLN